MYAIIVTSVLIIMGIAGALVYCLFANNPINDEEKDDV